MGFISFLSGIHRGYVIIKFVTKEYIIKCEVGESVALADVSKNKILVSEHIHVERVVNTNASRRPST